MIWCKFIGFLLVILSLGILVLGVYFDMINSTKTFDTFGMGCVVTLLAISGFMLLSEEEAGNE